MLHRLTYHSMQPNQSSQPMAQYNTTVKYNLHSCIVRFLTEAWHFLHMKLVKKIVNEKKSTSEVASDIS